MKAEEIMKRREQIAILLGKHLSQTEIAQTLGLDDWTVSRDIKKLMGFADYKIRELPKEYSFIFLNEINGLDNNIKDAELILANSDSDKIRLMAINTLAKCRQIKMELLNTGPMVSAVRGLNEEVQRLRNRNRESKQ